MNILYAAVGVLALTGADWPQGGRDNTRNPVSPEKGAPLEWTLPSRRKAASANHLWEARLGDKVTTPPAVADGLVWVATNNQRPRDEKVKEDHAVLMCFREKDGKFLWQYAVPRLEGNEDFNLSTFGCTPLAEEGRLTFVTNRGEVVCLDVSALAAGKGEPKVLWKADLRKESRVRLVTRCPTGKFTCSIGESYKGRIFVATGNGVDESGKLPAPKAPSLVCLDAKTGKALWADASPGTDLMWSSWSSPLVAEVKGRAQVMHAQGDGWLRSFDPLTGRLLWKFDLNPKGVKPYRFGGAGERCFPTASPVLYEGRVYIGVGQDPDDGWGVGHLWCIDPTKEPKAADRDVSPGTKEPALVWHHGGKLAKPDKFDREYVFGRTVSSVAVHDGLVVAPEYAGFVHCLDAKTGKPHWMADLEDAVTGSPLIADGKVYITTGGDTWVFALSKKERLLAKNAGTGTATPILANGVLYLTGHGTLHAIKAAPPRK